MGLCDYLNFTWTGCKESSGEAQARTELETANAELTNALSLVNNASDSAQKAFYFSLKKALIILLVIAVVVYLYKNWNKL